ncbi:MAG: hypothetical protein QW303_00270, partial [Nitrososphaerota archaeon]
LNLLEMFILAMLATITGASFINFLVGIGLDGNRILYIVLSLSQMAVVFLAGIIKGYRSVMKYEKLKSDHKYAALKNAEVNLSIQYQLSLNVRERTNDKIFLKRMIKYFNNILSLSPQIRESTRKRYLRQSEEDDIFNPNVESGNSAETLDENQVNHKLNSEIDRWLQHF